MSHKADESFFEKKRAWSKRKDLILGYYLTPYLAKIRKVGRPVLLVDGFAGPGRFGDGEIGSPLIASIKAKEANETPGPSVRVLCIEKDPVLCKDLKQNLSGFALADVLCGAFADYINIIKNHAKTHSVFLYVDPWRVSHIDWNSLEIVTGQVKAGGASVELLMNFNTPIFVRCALAAMKRDVPQADSEFEDSDENDTMPGEAPTIENLSRIVGGPWWKDVVSEDRPFWQVVTNIVEQLKLSLHKHFSEVCWTGLKKKREHLIPAYHMIFGSRHPDALELMNDAMVEARGHSDFAIDLFASEEVDKLILDQSEKWISRGELIHRTLQRAFCSYYRKEIRGRIEVLIRDKRLQSETGKTRINDSVRLRRCS